MFSLHVPVCAHVYLVIFFKDVVHLGYVLTADGLNDVSLVIGGVEAGTATTLSLTNERCAAGQRVLHVNTQNTGRQKSTVMLAHTAQKISIFKKKKNTHTLFSSLANYYILEELREV